MNLFLMFKIYKKVRLSMMAPLECRRYLRRSLISRLRHPSRSKFKGVASCFRQRFTA